MTATTPAPDDMPAKLFVRLSDEELKEAGWDAEWIVDDPEREGPFCVVRDKDALCRCCGSGTLGWTVLDLSTGCGFGTTWTHDEGEVEATEHAGALNAVWLKGHRARDGEVLRLREALGGLMREFDKFSRYGSPIARDANEAMSAARAALAEAAP